MSRSAIATPRPRRNESGLTLVELLMSLAILSTMMFLAWSTTSGTARIKRGVEAFQQRNHEVRLALARMNSDISMAYLSANENQGLQERRTLMVGKSSSVVDELRFSSMSHRPLWANSNESEQTLIVYYAESDPDKAGATNLLRRELRRLSNENYKNERAEVDILLHDIEKVSFEFWDWKDKSWKERWDTTAADGERGRLPTRVKITVELEEGDREVKFTTQARIMMGEELRFIAN